jgi:hypothetical protein
VPAVNEFSDVFFEELSVVSPEWDIELVIELVYGTAHICIRDYRMAAKWLAKLKDQIKELLKEGYIHLVHPFGEPYDFCLEKGWYLTDVHILSCSGWGYRREQIPVT